jgi:hypothetical protein
MEPTPLSRVTEWLRASRGGETQDHLAKDIERVTGWRITRDRYSKYENGRLPIGAQTLRHFVDYWASRGVEGPDTSPPVAADPVVAAIDRQTAMLKSVLDALVARSLEPELAQALTSWAVGQATTDLRLRSGGREPEPPLAAPNP